MATYAGLVTSIRRLLQDRPMRAQLGAAISDTTTATMTVTSGTQHLFQVGQMWEHDDYNGATSSTSSEQREITAVSGTTVTGIRGANGSTAATHLNSTYLLLEPRFSYDRICQAVDAVIDGDLLSNDVYEIVEHQVTISTTTDAYNAESTSCDHILDIYQRISATELPSYLSDWEQYRNADTTLFANGRYFTVPTWRGVAGTDLLYINCAHALSVTTLNNKQQDIVEYLAAYYLLSWQEIPRSAGPTNQGDRTVKVGDQARLAGFFRDHGMRLMREEASRLKKLARPRKNFVRL